jgi:hypothetical protein
VREIKNNIEVIYEENMQLKMRVLAFLNQMVVQTISSNPNVMEEIIKEND